MHFLSNALSSLSTSKISKILSYLSASPKYLCCYNLVRDILPTAQYDKNIDCHADFDKFTRNDGLCFGLLYANL